MNFDELEQKVIQWGEARNLYQGSNPLRQFSKLLEEQSELLEAITKNDYSEVEDAIGDMMVVLTSIARFYSMSLHICYQQAYEQIKDRRGKMVNGLFVKEETELSYEAQLLKRGPSYYTSKEGGNWKRWEYGSIKELVLVPDTKACPATVTLNGIKVHSLAFGTFLAGFGCFARWDCIRGWTDKPHLDAIVW